MALFLVQHGKSLTKEQDPEQGLAREGIDESERMARQAREYCLKVSCILHSGKKRARQTAEIFGAELRPERGLQEREGLKPLDDVKNFAGTLRSEENFMVVGHLPFMEKLISHLVTGDADKAVLRCRNSGIVCLDAEQGTGSWVIRWALVPNLN